MSAVPQPESPYEDNVSLSPSPPPASQDAPEDDDNYEDSLDLDTSNVGSSVWLVRLPKFLMEKWKDIDSISGKDLGMVRTVSQPGKPEKIKLILNDSPDTQDVPHEYDIKLVKQVVDNTYVFTEQDLPKFNKKRGTGTVYAEGMPKADLNSDDVSGDGNNSSGKTTNHFRNRDQRFIPYVKTIPKKTALTGTVRHECQVTPSLKDKNYSKVLSQRKQMESNTSRARVTFLNELPGVSASMFGPGMKGNTSAFLRSQKKDTVKTEGKAIRIPKNELLDLLFKLFEEYDYWSMKGLRERTKQPEIYLKEVLDSMAVLIKKGPYAMKYSLKPEFKQIKGMGSSLSAYMGHGTGGSVERDLTPHDDSIGDNSGGSAMKPTEIDDDDVEMETVF
jgi:transcription initiation factor TFIIF subunit beta